MPKRYSGKFSKRGTSDLIKENYNCAVFCCFYENFHVPSPSPGMTLRLQICNKCLSDQRYRIFFPGKVYFWTRFGKNRVSEWKLCFFFSGPVFFFRVLNLSEWVGCKLFQEKKNKVKKKHTWGKSGLVGEKIKFKPQT